MKPKSDAQVFRDAARSMEKKQRFGEIGGGVPPYPCWYVADAAGRKYFEWQDTDEVHRFLGAFSDCDSVRGMSNAFLNSLFDGSIQERDYSILALCFAAAMADEGDI